MAHFDAEELLGKLSGLELRACAEWLKENNWWDGNGRLLSAEEELFYMDLAKIGENKHRLTYEQEDKIRNIAAGL